MEGAESFGMQWNSTNMWCLVSVMVAVIVLVVFIVSRKTDVGRRAQAAIVRCFHSTPELLAFDDAQELDESSVQEGDYVLWYFPRCGWCQKFKSELMEHKDELAKHGVRIHTVNVATGSNNEKFGKHVGAGAGVPHLQRYNEGTLKTCEVPVGNGRTATGGYIPWEYLGPFMLS